MNVLQQEKQPFKFGKKALDFIYCPSKIDILEGTARSGKSTANMFKFGLRVDASDYNQFFVSGTTAGVARRNLINNQNGFLDMFKGQVREGTNLKYGNHLMFIDSKGREKIIYIFGFKDKARWQSVLGSTLGGGVIDEINVADTDFLNEVYRSVSSVDNFWFGATLNPDNPDKEVYELLINRTRPLKKWSHDIPFEIIQELKRQKELINDAIYWHFNFNDNPIMKENNIEFLKSVYPVGSFYYTSKILGIRGVAEGTIFAQYLNETFFSKNIEVVLNGKKQMMNEIDYKIEANQYIRYSIGVDLGNNELKQGTILTFTGITRRFTSVDPIDVYQCKSTESNELVLEICNKIKEWHSKIKDISRFEGVFIDGYGSIQVLIPTIRKKLWSMRLRIKVDLCIKFGTDGGRKARMTLLLLLINQKRLKFNNNKGARELYKNLRKIVYDEKDGLPLDTNQIEMDYYDSFCYSFTPFTTKLNDEVLGGALDKCLVG